MPNRILRDYTDSDAVNSLSALAERHFVRLIQKVDDYGRQRAEARILRPLLYPLLLDHVREADLERWTAECEKAGLIRLYELDGKRYLEVVNFNQRLRSSKAKFPPPPHDGHETAKMSCQSHDGHMTVICQTDDGHMTVIRRPESETETETKASVSRCATNDASFPPLPDSLDTPGMREAFAEFVRYRRERKPKLTRIGAERLLKRAAQFGPEVSIRCIHRAIEKGWQGIVWPDEQNSMGSPRFPQPPNPYDEAGREPTNEELLIAEGGHT